MDRTSTYEEHESMKLRMFLMLAASTSEALRIAVRPGHSLRPCRGCLLYSASKSSSDQQQAVGRIFWRAREKCWRPDVSDVERISWGKPAKKKGTGSRGVPHRLNRDERLLFDQARRKGFLEVVGSGWRSQRREAPLVNTYRSLCDARGQASIILHKGNTGLDEVVVDLSPLRLPETFAEVANACAEYLDLPAEQVGGNLWEEDVSRTVDPDDISGSEDPWDSTPIYQLSPYCVSWELPRSDAKALGKRLAEAFDTVEQKASKSRKPRNVKPGKNRRSGGYGIG